MLNFGLAAPTAMPALPANFALFAISIDTRHVHDFMVTKGQLISKAIYGVLSSPKKTNVLKIIPVFIFWEN